MRSENLKTTNSSAARKRGRPRSQQARAAILSSALHLARQQGLKPLTMGGIARQAGVSKETLYRWWRSKGEVLLEAVAQVGDDAIPIPDTGAVTTDLQYFMRSTADALDPPLQRVLRALAAEAASDLGFAEEVRDRFLARRRDALGAVLRRGVERGEISQDQVETALDFVFGALWYRLIFAVGPLDRNWASSVATALSWKGPSR